MTILKLLRLMITAALAVLSTANGASIDYSDDTFIYNQPPGVKSPAPNILIILDNTPNWARNSQQWATSTQGGAELAAIQQFVAGLKQQANIGLMMFTNLGSKVDGAYVRFGVRDLSVQANSLAFQAIVSSINPNQSDEKVCQNCGDYANALYETWLYFTGASASWAGMDPLADYAGNAGTNQDKLTAYAKGMSSGFAYKGSANGSGYNGPIGTGCAKSYVIFIGNNVRGGCRPRQAPRIRRRRRSQNTNTHLRPMFHQRGPVSCTCALTWVREAPLPSSGRLPPTPSTLTMHSRMPVSRP
ncbi:hypothetical protein [Cupriavidus sp. D39]|uniref:hypothetical protein n=1 Tax=Cupriavidus sp. D39 TaxID=2997877 RepID=UPI0022716100|nr:hypothetical protein [Cupriavidus sp. D39]MCY0854927.1 hypothetical protein [Cupriavidus sp. D39]